MALEFNRTFDPHYGEAVKVAPNVRRLTATNSGPFTFSGTNSFIIGEGRLAVLDPGPDDPGHVGALLDAIAGETVEAILVSHTHRDHSPGARYLREATGAPIKAAGPQVAARPLQAGETNRLDASADHDFKPDEVLADGAQINIGDVTLEAVATPGHTANHLVFSMPEAGILFSGDHVMAWSTTVVAPPDGAMGDYMASLERLLARDERLYLPAHGGPVSDPERYVRGLRAHRKMREQVILERLQKGDRSIAGIVENIYRDIDPRLHGAAALSVFAHLEELVAQGLVSTTDAVRLDAEFAPARPRRPGGA
ncbi:MAG TPA: MBL fold metallo-hydrolase [Afifellaceae bacterium]|nr:MBL fold metallo-hydrolase [Afifellaceae bacterium]